MKRPPGKIHLYTMSLNEMAMLPFFFRHYDELVDRYFIYDDGSTDGTLEQISAHPKVELRRFDRTRSPSFLHATRIFHNAVWKESRGHADWVILTAIDEHLSHPDMAAYLAQCRRTGVTAVPALGYQMVSRTRPPPKETLSKAVTTGAPYSSMNKLSIFNPDAIRETNYAIGRHVAAPQGDVSFPPRDEVVLLHYKYIDPSYTAPRQKLLLDGIGAFDRRWTRIYIKPRESVLREFKKIEKLAIDISAPDYCPHTQHRQSRWWRKSPGRRRLAVRWAMHKVQVLEYMSRYASGRLALHVLRSLKSILLSDSLQT